jgi:hypothetical protein
MVVTADEAAAGPAVAQAPTARIAGPEATGGMGFLFWLNITKIHNMKNILILLLFPFALSAQVVKDTIITIVENDTTTLIFRETTTVEGLGQVIRRVYIGGTQEEAVANIFTGAEGTIRTYARQAITFATRRVRQELQPTQTLLSTYTGRTWFADMAARHGSTIAGNYRYRKNGANEVQVSITRPTAASLRLTSGGNNFTVRAIGREWIQVLNFDGLAVIDLYWDGIRYIDVTNTYELRRL